MKKNNLRSLFFIFSSAIFLFYKTFWGFIWLYNIHTTGQQHRDRQFKNFKFYGSKLLQTTNPFLHDIWLVVRMIMSCPCLGQDIFPTHTINVAHLTKQVWVRFLTSSAMTLFAPKIKLPDFEQMYHVLVTVVAFHHKGPFFLLKRNFFKVCRNLSYFINIRYVYIILFSSK